MNKLNKAAHTLFACMWLGSTCSVALLQCLRGWSHDGRVLAALNLDLGWLGLTLVIPGALGSLLTGFLLCQAAGWRILRHRWVVAKCIGALSGSLAGSILLIPWQIRLVNLSGELVGAPAPGSEYDVLRLWFTIIGFVQIYLLMTMVAVGVLKPWGERVPQPVRSRAASPAGQAVGARNRQPAAQSPAVSDP